MKHIRFAAITLVALITGCVAAGVTATNDVSRQEKSLRSSPDARQVSRLSEKSAPATITALVRAVDLDVGESQEVELADGSKARVRLLDVQETRDHVRNAVRQANVTVEVNGASVTCTSANYHLPVTVGGVQIDCPVTRGYLVNDSQQNAWRLGKDARLRLWPAGSPWVQPGTFTYPVRQRWFAGDTQMANEPCFVDGAERPGVTSIYYHYGLDFGGAEGLVQVVAATDGLVVSAAGQTLPEHSASPAKSRYDVIYIVDGRGWYYRYSHLMTIDVKPGQRVRMGERIGLLGKEGGSGGWSHLHFDITSRQPSGEWGIQDAYAYAWQAYQHEYRPKILAVARPHRLAAVGEKVTLDGTKSWSAAGGIARYDWTFTDGGTASGATVERIYERPGTYSEILKVADGAGRAAWDFAVVEVQDSSRPQQLPPTIHAAYYPTTDIRPGDAVTFKVRTFRTTYEQERWDFGDGSAPVPVRSDGNANMHAKDGYAVTEHRYTRPGHYLVRVERSNEREEKAVGHLTVEVQDPFTPRTRVSIREGRWLLNDQITYPGTKAEGLLMNVRMVNAVFEDRNRPGFDPNANTEEFIAQVSDYVTHGICAFTICLQGGSTGYEGAINSAFNPDGSLRSAYLHRVRRVIEACDRSGAVVILGCYYQRQDQVLKDEAAVRAGVVNVAKWINDSRFTNVVLEIANEFGHNGFDHRLLKGSDGITELIGLAKQTLPALLVSASGLGGGALPDRVAGAGDFLLIHFNGTATEDIPARIGALMKFNKPIVCNEDQKVGREGAKAAELCVANGASWGFMLVEVNQHFPFTFQGVADDPEVYAAVERMTVADYFPAPESQGGWRKLDRLADVRKVAGMDPAKLDELREWLLASDKRDFAAVVIRRGWIVLEVERGNSAKTDSRRVASVSKAVCATVLAIAAEQSQQGLTPRKMKFDDPAFDFIPWAQPLSDPRKAQITVKQLLNHTSGLCPEASGAPNDGTWEYVLGHTGDPRTAKLAFTPGAACGYSTHALDHAALVCETVTGKPYDRFAVESLFKPLGIEHWWFQYFDGGEKIGRHPTHGLGMPARDLARIAYCMLHDGRWGDRQVIPKWFVDETAAPTHNVQSPEMRWKLNPQIFSHSWELPSRLTGEGGRSGEGIAFDARDKPGSGGQLIAFVPSLDLVITRQTGGSGDWAYEEYLRRACASVARD